MPNFYDTDRAVSEYLLFHYGPPEWRMPWPAGPHETAEFAVRCVTETFTPTASTVQRALDLGCAVGRSTFELSRTCMEVIGIDASARFVEAADALRRGDVLGYDVVVEGQLARPLEARRPPDSRPDRIVFEAGDALRLREGLGTFDRVLAANLLDRVPDPEALLRSLGALVKSGGELVLTSPYTWLEEYTPRDRWLTRDGRPSSEVLAELLSGFRRVRRLDLPFVIREHARKFQWSVAEATVWQRV